MTSIESQPSRLARNGGPGAPGRRKTLLFCPDCGYEGHAAEDWDVLSDEDGSAFVCPTCETVVARR